MSAGHSLSRCRAALALAAAACLLAGCSPLQAVNAVLPSAHYERVADLGYGDHPRQRLDLYLPVERPAEAPVVVYFYGGGWNNGARAQYQFVAAALTRAGYTVVLPDYRLYPEVRFPAFVEDGAAAVAWVVAHAAELGWDGDGLYLAGHSAGAHIAALLAADARYLEAAGVSRSTVDGFIGLSGPYDFLPLGEGYLRDLFPEALRPRSQPIRFVDEATAPSLLVHGMDDEVVEPGNSERLAARLRSVGVPVELVLYPDVGHAAVAAAFLPGLAPLADTERDVLQFLERRERERRANP